MDSGFANCLEIFIVDAIDSFLQRTFFGVFSLENPICFFNSSVYKCIYWDAGLSSTNSIKISFHSISVSLYSDLPVSVVPNVLATCLFFFARC